MSAVTAPWTDEAVTVMAGGAHHRVLTVTLTHPDLPTPVVLDLDPDREPTLDMSEAWAPAVRAQVTVRLPDEDTSRLLDSRGPARIVLRAGYVYASGRTDVHQIADLMIASGAEDWGDGTCTLDLTGDELAAQTSGPLPGQSPSWPWTQPIPTVLAAILTRVSPGRQVVTMPGVSTASLGEGLTVAAGDTWWPTIRDLADRIDAWVYDDGLRWVIAPRPTLDTRPAAVLRTGLSGTITALTSDVDRADFANAVIVQYADGATGYAEVTSGRYGTGQAPRVVLTVDRTTVTRPANATNVALAIASRAVTRGRSWGITAIGALWLRPGDTITVHPPGRTPETCLLASVRHLLVSGSMVLTTRTPDTGA
ncbi:phage tail protein [Cellulomonas sp. NPDC089187]|uniref:phage tail protein n=1 Tax=Cellulomonas sp. NPDC089187 TaxID=3154970 RepID=UPI00342F2003